MWSVSLNAVGWIAATTTAAVIALGLWRHQLIAKRRYEIAELLVEGATKAVGALQYARSGLGYVGEGKTRERSANEDPAKSDWYDRQYVPIERLQKSEGVFQELFRCRVLAEMHFGPAAATPFQTLIDARHEIVFAAQDRMSNTRTVAGEWTIEAKESDLKTSLILANTGNKNPLTMQIDAALDLIKAMADDELRPHWITRFLPMIGQQRAKRISIWWVDLCRRYRRTWF